MSLSFIESEKHCQEQFVGSLGHLLSKEWLTSVKGCIVTLHRKTARTETLPVSFFSFILNRIRLIPSLIIVTFFDGGKIVHIN